FLHPRAPRGAGRLRFGPDMSILTWSSGVWAALAAANVLVSAPESNGVPLSRLAELGAFGPLYTFGYMPRAWTVTTVGAAVLWLCSYWSTRWTTLLPGLWAGVVGASAPVVVGQVLVGPHHDVGSDAGTIQLLAAALLLGPVLVAEGIRWLSRAPSRRGPLALRRQRRRHDPAARRGAPAGSGAGRRGHPVALAGSLAEGPARCAPAAAHSGVRNVDRPGHGAGADVVHAGRDAPLGQHDGTP